MSKRTTQEESGAGDTAPKVVIYCRIDPTTIAGLDEIADSMRPKPTRAMLIDTACAEYVEKHGKSGEKRAKAG